MIMTTQKTSHIKDLGRYYMLKYQALSAEVFDRVDTETYTSVMADSRKRFDELVKDDELFQGNIHEHKLEEQAAGDSAEGGGNNPQVDPGENRPSGDI